MIRLLIVDDHAVFRAGVRAVFNGQPAFDVVGEASAIAEAVAASARLVPDVILLDITLPDGSGLEAVARLRAAAPAARVVFLSVHDGSEYVVEAVRAGAHGYLRKDAAPSTLRQAVQAVMDGGEYFAADVAAHLTAAVRNAPSRLDRLSPREREVLALVAQGKTSKEIAVALGISVRTAEAHRDSIGKKTGVRSAAALTRLALGHDE